MADEETVLGDDAPADDSATDDTPLETDDTPAEPPQENHEPPPDHPRFKEIYGKLKTQERDNAELRDGLESIKEHNRKLEETLFGVEDKLAETNRPDPIDDPDGYERFVIDKAKREIKKESTPDVPLKDSYDFKAIGQQEQQLSQVPEYNDYFEVVKTANADMNTDPILRREILSATNPALAAYQYAKAKGKKAAAATDSLADQAYAEGGTPPPGNLKKGEPTDQQKHTAKLLGVDIKKYMKQVEHIEKQRG